jgi:hypothetical protein
MRYQLDQGLVSLFSEGPTLYCAECNKGIDCQYRKSPFYIWREIVAKPGERAHPG